MHTAVLGGTWVRRIFLVSIAAGALLAAVGFINSVRAAVCSDCFASNPTLTVIKKVVSDDGGTRASADFTIEVYADSALVASFAGADDPGTTTTISIPDGSESVTYEVRESTIAGYASSTFSADCSGTIGYDEERTCTITNDDLPGFLTVIKEVVNTGGGTKTASEFTINVSGTDISSSTFAGVEGQGYTVTLDAGNYSVTETAVTDYTVSYSADCSGTITNVEVKTCTVTNTYVAPAPVLALHIFNERILGVSDSTITLAWDTDHPATSRVVYDTQAHITVGTVGPNYDYAFSTEENSALVTSHSMVISGLTSSTPYYLRPVSHGSPEVVGLQLGVSTQGPGGGGQNFGVGNGGGGGGGGGVGTPATPSAPAAPPGAAAPTSPVVAVAPAPQAVLGIKIEDPAPAVAPKAVLGFNTLPNTGGGQSNSMMLVGLGMIGLGALLIRRITNYASAS